MKGSVVVYVPVPDDTKEEAKDGAVKETADILISNRFLPGGTAVLSDPYGQKIRVRIWAKSANNWSHLD